VASNFPFLRGLVPAAAVHQMPDVDRAPRDGHGPLDVTGNLARVAWADRRRERPPPSTTPRFGDFVLDAPVRRVLLHARQTRRTDAKFRRNAAFVQRWMLRLWNLATLLLPCSNTRAAMQQSAVSALVYQSYMERELKEYPP
jgi:hypothetical protein